MASENTNAESHPRVVRLFGNRNSDPYCPTKTGSLAGLRPYLVTIAVLSGIERRQTAISADPRRW
jgi:hypothetical protein